MKILKIITLQLILTIILIPNISFCDEIKLIPSGNVVSAELYTDHPYIIKNIGDKNNTLQKNDIILSIKYGINKTYDLDEIYELMKIQNKKLCVTILRNGSKTDKTITSDILREYVLSNRIECGWTVTAIDMHGKYVATAHGLYIGGNIHYTSINNAKIYETIYVQDVKSTKDEIGYLEITPSDEIIGSVDSISKYGTKGTYYNFEYDDSKALEISKPKVGKAYVYCESPITNKLDYHEIEILDVMSSRSSIKIKDKSLINIRGGGVRGMSGSPIIQNNKIVGALSHINDYDTTTGYMTDISYMLNPSLK